MPLGCYVAAIETFRKGASHAEPHCLDTVPLRANLTLMCGCPTEPKGLWDSSRYELQATVKHNGKPLTQTPLKYAGKTSTFEGVLTVEQKGAYEVTVSAFDPATGNAGVDSTTFVVE